MRESLDDFLGACGPGAWIANQDLLAAGALDRGSEWSLESDGVQKLVFLIVVRVLRRHAFDEIVVDEGEPKNVIARGQIQAHLLF